MKPVNSVSKQATRINNYHLCLKKEIQQSINNSGIQYKQLKNNELRTSTATTNKSQKFKTTRSSRIIYLIIKLKEAK